MAKELDGDRAAIKSEASGHAQESSDCAEGEPQRMEVDSIDPNATDTSTVKAEAPQLAKNEDRTYYENPYIGDQDLAGAACESPETLEHLRQVALELCEKIAREVEPAANLAEWDVYSGNAGIARLFLRLHELAPDVVVIGVPALELAERYMDAAVQGCTQFLTSASVPLYNVGYLRGQSGVWATGVVVYHNSQKDDKATQCSQRLMNLKSIAFSPRTSHDLTFGRLGYLYAAMYARRYAPECSQWITDDLLKEVFQCVVSDGQAGSDQPYYLSASRSQAKRPSFVKSPLVWQWFMERYMGAAHGLAGGLEMCMSIPAFNEGTGEETLKQALSFVVQSRLRNNGFRLRPTEATATSPNMYPWLERNDWSFGACGIALCLCRGYELWGNVEFLECAKLAADAVWERGLTKAGTGLANGVAGNTYLFLTLYSLTNDSVFWKRALIFAKACENWETAYGATGLSGHGLFEGTAGIAHLYLEMCCWDKGEFLGFPGFSDVMIEDVEA
ncbi:LanC-like protein 2 [Gaertneriomyces sp. JEL0708]|nr:LanC-like protein 2 [Gaertneriomyces sp. JEL0708]